MLQEVRARLQQTFCPPPYGPSDSGKTIRSYLFLALALAVMVAYFVPFLLLGSNSYITIHDNLDGEFVEKYLLVATGKALIFNGNAPIDNIMNGLPRAALPSGLNVSVLLFYVFPPAWAYIVNYILVHIIAFSGMFLLLRKHFLTDDDDYLIALAISVLFFLVPYYTTHGLSAAGQPLLAYAFLNIRGGRYSWADYLIILLFPLWSNIALIAPFAVTTLLLILVVDWVRSRRLNKSFLVSILLFAAVYIALQYQLIASVLGAGKWLSQRSTWDRWNTLNVHLNLKSSLELFLTTQYHSGSFYTLPVIIATGATLVLLLAKMRRAGLLDVLAIGIALICLEFGFYDWIVLWFGRVVPALQTFNASRFYFLLPLLWMLLLALNLRELKRIKWGMPIVCCLLAAQAFAMLKFNTEYADNLRLLTGKRFHEPTFKQFFAQDLFAQVDQFIGRPKNSYRVVSIGMHPSVTQFNGFYTLDGYLSTYPLSYKLQFRRIIAKELAKDETIRDYFDGWGNRCYVFTSEFGNDSLFPGKDHMVLHNLQLDTGQLRAMGGEYVISAAYIENSEQHGLRFEKQFSSPGSFWDIYLYEVLPPMNSQLAPAIQ